MIYPHNAAEKLGFSEIKELIKSHCLSPMGRQMVDRIQVMTAFDQVRKFLHQTHEFKMLLQNDEAIPIQNLHDLKKLAEKIRLEGAFLLEEEFFQILLSLTTVFSVIRYFEERKGIYPNLENLFEHVTVEKDIIRKIENTIDVKGKIKNNASAALQEILTGINKAEQEARKKIEQVFRNAQNNNWTGDGNLTVREGRLCIPILAENKRKLKGFIHDESSTGQTVFIEPEEVFHLNNTIRDLEFDKRREIIRILTNLTDELRPYVPAIIAYHGLLTKLDFVRAKALFAISIEAEMPELSPDPLLDLINARHPLLFLNLIKEKQTVVPLNIRIKEEQRIIVVSGPNAGGKSVAMKTVGLLQMMIQSGLLIPASPDSKTGIFKQIFADIGDDQSIESDLSTYSAHLSKMKYFIENSNSKTLILIDEFGTGTDPKFGGPIAEAVLEALNQKKVRGIVTTHYSNLKLFANSANGVENASMLFDNLEMKPLYILETGKPGSSYAFEIAEKIGLPKHVLQSARHKVGEQQKKVDSLLVDLERDKKELMDTKQDIERREKRVSRLLEENEKLKTYYEENKKLLIKEAKLEAQDIIRNANKLIENTIAEIKRSKADKDLTLQLRQNLQEEIRKNEVVPEKPKRTEEPASLKAGDWVKVADTGTIGQVLEIAKENVILAIGELRSVVKLKRIEKISNKEVPKEIRRSFSQNITESMSRFNPEIDLRGKRAEEALNEMEKYLDKAIMMGIPSLRIIHGKGDGILRKVIRAQLMKYSQVTRFEDEHIDRGGDGITYVYLD